MKIDFFHNFWIVFIALFVAVDAIGTIPLFISITTGLDRKRLRKVLIYSVITALAVGNAFLFMGKSILTVLGITIADFMIAGGIILFLITVTDMLSLQSKQHPSESQDIGPVPLGVPLIVGPAVLTAGLLLLDQHGFILTSACLSINVIFAGVLFYFSFGISHVIGQTGAKIISKLAGLLLGAYAVMMIRKGILLFINP